MVWPDRPGTALARTLGGTFECVFGRRWVADYHLQGAQAMKNKTQGLTVRTAEEHKATTKKVLGGDTHVGGMEVPRPEPKPHHRYEVQIYDVRYGRFVYQKYVSSLDEAKREMARQRALGHRAKHVAVVHVQRGPIGRRYQGPGGGRSFEGTRRKGRNIPKPVPEDPELKALKGELEALRKTLGLDAATALPNSKEKCRQLIKRLRANFA
jgi:hypothetical protein